VTTGDQDRDAARDVLKRALAATTECIPLERFAEELSATDREHLTTCPRCRTELRLWEEFGKGAPAPQDGAAVQWIAAEIRRRRAGSGKRKASGSVWGWIPLRGIAAAAATLIVGIAVGYVAWEREPGLRETSSGPQTYRTAKVDVVGPVGEVASAPTELGWKVFSGAVRYEVSLLEVDRTQLWMESTTTTRATLPAGVRARLVPGKTVVWEVKARDASGSVIAESGAQRFRVAIDVSAQ
jgi:hypothetical protein